MVFSEHGDRVNLAFCLVSFFLFGCSVTTQQRGLVSNPSASSEINITAATPSTFGDLKRALRVAPLISDVTGQDGKKVEDASTANWYAGDQLFLSAFFASTHISDDDVPWRVDVSSPFQGAVEGIRLGTDSGVQSWNARVSEGKRCALLSEYGSSGVPICKRIPGMPDKIPAWGVYEINATSGQGGITAVRFQNFHVQVVNVAGKLHLRNTTDDEIRGRMLAMVHHYSDPDPVNKEMLAGLMDPKTHLNSSVGVARGAEALYLNGMCSGQDFATEARFYGQLAEGLRNLLSAPPWSKDDPSSKLHRAAVALAQFADAYRAGLRAGSQTCSSRSRDQMPSARKSLQDAAADDREFLAYMKELGIGGV